MSLSAIDLEQPVGKRTDVSVKVDFDAIRIARNVATFEGKTLAEYLSEIVLARATVDWQTILAKETRESGTPKRPKGKG